MTRADDPYTEVVRLGPTAFFLLTLWIGKLDGEPTTPGRLVRTTGLSKYKVNKALQALELCGYARLGGLVWQLTGNVAQLEMFTRGETPEISPIIDAEFEREKLNRAVEPPGVKNFFLLVVKKLRVKDSLNIYLTSSREKIFSSDLLNICQDIFGERPVGRASQYPPDVLLGWMAQAWDQRDLLRHPARVIYTRIVRERAMPEPQYLIDPVRYLADAFEDTTNNDDGGHCENRQSDPATPEMAVPPSTSIAPASPPETAVIDESLSKPINGKWTALKAWGAAKDQLQREMPRSAFDDHVETLRPAYWDGDFLILEAQSKFQAEWLADRMTSTIGTILTGILARKVGVEFEIKEKTK